MEEEKGMISSCHAVVFQNRDIPEIWGLRFSVGGKISKEVEWDSIPYDIFLQLGGTPPSPIIRLVEGGYIGRALSHIQRRKLPEGYCPHCLKELGIYYLPIVGTDKKIRCSNCLQVFKPSPFKV